MIAETFGETVPDSKGNEEIKVSSGNARVMVTLLANLQSLLTKLEGPKSDSLS